MNSKTEAESLSSSAVHWQVEDWALWFPHAFTVPWDSRVLRTKHFVYRERMLWKIQVIFITNLVMCSFYSVIFKGHYWKIWGERIISQGPFPYEVKLTSRKVLEKTLKLLSGQHFWKNKGQSNPSNHRWFLTHHQKMAILPNTATKGEALISFSLSS